MTVAVKTIKRYKSEQAQSDFLQEMGIMMKLMHPNVVHHYGLAQQGIAHILIIDYIYNVNLHAIVLSLSAHLFTACALGST